MLGFCVVCLFVIFMSTVLKGYASFSGIYVVCYVFYFRGRLLSDFQCGRLTCRTMLTVLKQCISLHYCMADNTHGKDEANLVFWLAIVSPYLLPGIACIDPMQKKNCVKQAYKGYNLCTMSGHTTEDSNNKENTLNKFHDLNLVQKATLFPRTQKSKSFVILIKPKSFCHYMINPWYIYQLKL